MRATSALSTNGNITMSTAEIHWNVKHTMAGEVVLDTVLVGTMPDGEPVMIGSYVRDRNRWVLYAGPGDFGPFDDVEQAKAAAVQMISA